MNKKYDLEPPFSYIETLLKSINDESIDGEVSDGSNTKNEAIIDVGIPEDIATLIQRRVNAESNSTDDFEVGQIREIIQINNKDSKTIKAPLSILLLEKHGTIWRGLGVSPFINYASNQEVLIESMHELFADPMAGMIHTKLDLNIDEKQLGKIQSKLSNQRIMTIQEVCEGKIILPNYKYKPGQLLFAKTNSGMEFLTGQPLNELDYRLEFTHIYQSIAELANSSNKESNIDLLDLFWQNINALQQRMSDAITLEEQISYAMSESGDSKVIRVSGLNITVSIEENASNILLTSIHNSIDTIIEFDVVRDSIIEQSFKVNPDEYSEAYLEEGVEYQLVIINPSNSEKTILDIKL